MAGIRSRIGQAAATHRRAAAIANAADTALAGYVPRPRISTEHDDLPQLAQRLTAAAAQLAPGWLGSPLVPTAPELPADPAATESTGFVRLGTAHLSPDTTFPVVVPSGGIAFDTAADDPRVAGALQGLLLRLLASHPAGSLLVRLVDPAAAIAGPFAALHDAGITPPPARDQAGLDNVLAEAQRWARDPDRHRRLVVVIAGWPPDAGKIDAGRIAALAGGGVHLLVGGWPPPQGGDGLAGVTRVALRRSYALVGHPPGGSFAAAAPPGAEPSPGLHAEVTLDPAPAAEQIDQVCRRLAGHALDHARVSLGELLPAGPMWTEDAAGGLTVAVGRAGDAAVTLRLGHPARHCLIGGRARSGKSTLLHDIAYGLASRYHPEQLGLYLLDPAPGGAFADLAAAVPHVRAVGSGSANRVRAVLHEVAALVAQRRGPARILCLLDGWHALPDQQAHSLLDGLAAADPERGVHLLLAGDGPAPDTLAARCRLRVALPGGQVLDPANDSAAGLALGTAVVNTASGLGGPRGATRAHEQLVHFPDPYADPVALAGLRHRLSRAGDPS